MIWSEHKQNPVDPVDPVGVALVLHVQRQVLLAFCVKARQTEVFTTQASDQRKGPMPTYGM